jgi:F-type H+-transporting ATPase subunit delta
MRASKSVRRSARALLRLCIVDGVLDQARTRQVTQGIARSGRRGALSVLADFQRLVRLDRDRHTALVESATPLAANLREKIYNHLVRAHGPHLQTSFEENPVLIAGIRIKVGSNVYDSSVRARLAALAARL